MSGGSFFFTCCGCLFRKFGLEGDTHTRRTSTQSPHTNKTRVTTSPRPPARSQMPIFSVTRSIFSTKVLQSSSCISRKFKSKVSSSHHLTHKSHHQHARAQNLLFLNSQSAFGIHLFDFAQPAQAT